MSPADSIEPHAWPGTDLPLGLPKPLSERSSAARQAPRQGTQPGLCLPMPTARPLRSNQPCGRRRLGLPSAATVSPCQTRPRTKFRKRPKATKKECACLELRRAARSACPHVSRLAGRPRAPSTPFRPPRDPGLQHPSPDQAAARSTAMHGKRRLLRKTGWNARLAKAAGILSRCAASGLEKGAPNWCQHPARSSVVQPRDRPMPTFSLSPRISRSP